MYMHVLLILAVCIENNLLLWGDQPGILDFLLKLIPIDATVGTFQ